MKHTTTLHCLSRPSGHSRYVCWSPACILHHAMLGRGGPCQHCQTQTWVLCWQATAKADMVQPTNACENDTCTPVYNTRLKRNEHTAHTSQGRLFDCIMNATAVSGSLQLHRRLARTGWNHTHRLNHPHNWNHPHCQHTQQHNAHQINNRQVLQPCNKDTQKQIYMIAVR